MMKTALVLMFLALAMSVNAQQSPEKFGVFVVGSSDADAGPVAKSLIQKLQASKPFAAVSKDVSKVVVMVSCMPRKQTDPFVCMYVSELNGATFKTFLGGGLYFALKADDVADNFLAALAADMVERYDQTSKDNIKQSLETCLFLTESRCNVPEVLQKEVGATQISLSQWLLKQNH